MRLAYYAKHAQPASDTIVGDAVNQAAQLSELGASILMTENTCLALGGAPNPSRPWAAGRTATCVPSKLAWKAIERLARERGVALDGTAA